MNWDYKSSKKILIDHSRKSIRLHGYDYSQSGYYFVTVCTQNREHVFGNIIDGKMVLNGFGLIVNVVWQSLSNHHPVKLDSFQIMPNHVHFIINITNMGASRRAPTLGFIIGMFKSECTKRIHNAGWMHAVGVGCDRPTHVVWQRNYYEHIIRNKSEYYAIKQYIHENPLYWDTDEENI